MINPLTSSGGYVMGTLITPTLRPFSERSVQRVFAWMSLELTKGRVYPCVVFAQKSKTPCLPGFFPVMKETQAGAVTGGKVDLNEAETPLAMSLDRVGSFPCLTMGGITSKVAPSIPITRTL